MNAHTKQFAVFLLSSALFFANGQVAFPQGSCGARACIGSPYTFTWTSHDDTNGIYCFQLQNNNAQSACATTFRQQTTKIVIKSQPICQDPPPKITIDGVVKGGGVYFTTFGINNSLAELRATSMNYDNNTVANVTFCIVTKPPCLSLNALCGGDTCYYSVYDPFTHLCCPVCAFAPMESDTRPIAPLPPPPHVNSPPSPPLHVNSPPPPHVNSPPSPPPVNINFPMPPPQVCNNISGCPAQPILQCLCTCTPE